MRVLLALGAILAAGCRTGASGAAERATASGGEGASTVGGRAPDGSAGREQLRYVALGDSYTIGTSVERDERWPDQLVARMAADEPSLELVANLAVNGYTSRDVIERQLPELEALRPEFVSLLVGVNDVVQGVPPDRYEANLDTILDHLLAAVPASRIVMVATPDYTVTPAGADYGDPTARAAGIVEVNAIASRAARDRGIAWVDIHDISLLAATDRSLVAGDGLHPSGMQYERWVERILPVVRDLLGA